MSQLEENKAVVRTFLSAVDLHDAGSVDAILHEDHRLEYPGNTQLLDRDGHWRLIASYHAAFEDMKHRPDTQVAEGDHVVTRGTITGTHTGPLLGMPATGRTVSVQFVNMARIVDGRICGMFSLFDSTALQEQLGAHNVAYRDTPTGSQTE